MKMAMSKVGAAFSASVVVMVTMPAAPAAADPSPVLGQAVTDARATSSCGPLAHNPVIEHGADIVNRSTFSYLDHTAENVPADGADPSAIVRDLGVDPRAAATLQGAGRDVTAAVKGLLLQGRNVILDCAYTDFGTSTLYEPQSGYFLAVVVVVGT